MLRPARSSRRWFGNAVALVAITAVTPLLSRIAYPAMFSRFYSYDDEGYLLVSLRAYMAGEPLYDSVFSQYGPFQYQATSAIFKAASTMPTHDHGRLVTLSIWLVASAVAGVGAYLLTRNVLLAAGSQALAFTALFTVTNEPLHPGALLNLLLLCMVAVVPFAASSPRFAWAILGALGGAMALTKVNVGGLALVALAAVAVLSSDVPRRLRAVVAGAFVAVPFLLMARDLTEQGVLAYAFVVSSAAATVAAMALARPPSTGPGALRWLVAGAAGSSVLIAVAAILRGTSVGGLITGVLVRPLGQGEAFTLPMTLFPQVVVWSAAGLLVGLGTSLVITRRTAEPPPAATAVARIVAGLVMWLAVGGIFGPSVPAFALGLPVAWVMLLPGIESDRRGMALAVAALAVLQALHAYPVAGSQTSWSGLLLAPLGAVAISDGIRGLAATRAARLRRLVAAASMLPVAAVLAWVVLGPLTTLHDAVRAAYLGWPAPRLAGAERLRMDPATAAAYPRVVRLLRAECSSFYSWPGMNSFYLFAQQPPPTNLNATHWMTLFDDELQRRVVQDIADVDDLCLLRNRDITAFWLQGRPEPQGPLTEYLRASFVPRAAVSGFELLVRPR